MVDPALPLWVRVGPAIVVPVVAFLAMGAAAAGWGLVGRLVVGSVPADLFWVERARRTWPVRRGATALILAGAAAGGVMGSEGGLTGAPYPSLVILGSLGGFLGAFFGAATLGSLDGVHLPLHRRLRDAVTSVLVFAPHLFVVVVLALLMPARFDVQALALGAMAALVTFAAQRGDFIDVMRGLGLASDAPDRLRVATQTAAARSGRAEVPVHLLATRLANAVAFPPGGRVAATEGLLEAVDDAGLTSIMAHEIGHLDEPVRVRAARIVGAQALAVPLVFARPLHTSFGWLGLIGAGLVVVVILRLVGRIARRMEEAADTHAHHQEGDPGVHARALEATYRHNLAPAVMGGSRQVHPDLYDRLVAAGVAPGWPRPAPPRGRDAVFAAIAGGVALGLALSGVAWARNTTRRFEGEPGALLRLAVGEGRPSDYGAIAFDRYDQEDLDGAAYYYAAWAAADPNSVWATGNLALVEVRRSACVEAARAVRETRGRAESRDGPDAELDAFLAEADRAVRNCFGAHDDAAATGEP